MLVLAYLYACSCHEVTDTGTDLDTTDATDFGDSGTPKKDTVYGSSGDTGNTTVPSICANTMACWRFESVVRDQVDDLSGHGHALTLAGDATIDPSNRTLPDGTENLGRLDLRAEPDYAFVDVKGTMLGSYPDGLTVEGLIRQADEGVDAPFTIAPDSEGSRIRTIAWLTNGAVVVRLQEDDKGNASLVARVNYEGDVAQACGAEAVAAYDKSAGLVSCVSVTYAGGSLRLFSNGVEVASGSVPKDCADGDAVGPVSKGGQLRLGADGTVGKPAGDHTWRGQLDEVRILTGAVDPKALMCALGAPR